MARSIVLNFIGNDRVSAALRRVGAEMERASDRAATLEKAAARLDRAARLSSVAAAAGVMASLAKATAPATAAVAALPAATLTAAAATSTLRVGLLGLGDAMDALASGDAEDLKEALDKLSPAAQKFVLAIRDMRGDFTALKNAVQDRLFAGLAGDFERLARAALPTVRTGMTQLAGSFNGVAREAMRVASTPWFSGHVERVFASTSRVTRTLTGAIEPLIRLALTLADAGAPLVERLAGWAVQGVRAASAWVEAKSAAGSLQAAVQGTGDALAQWGRIVVNLAVGLGNVIGQARDMNQVMSGGLLANLETATRQFRDWATSAQGQAQTAAVFRELGETLNTVAMIAPVFTGALEILAGFLRALPAPVRDAVSQFAAWAIVINLVVVRLRLLRAAAAAAQFATGVVKGAQLADNASAAAKYGAALRANIAALRTWVVEHTRAAVAATRARVATLAHAAAQRIAAAATRLWAAAQWVLNAAMRANPIVWVVTALGVLAAAVVVAYQRVAWFRSLVDTVWRGLQAAAQAVWSAVQPVLTSLARVVGTILVIAFRLLLNTAKIVWIAIQILVLAAWAVIRPILAVMRQVLVSLLIPAFRMVRSAASAAWRGVQAAIQTAWNIIRPIWSAARDWLSRILSGAFRTLKSAVSAAMNGVKSVVSTVWNSGLRPAFDRIKSAVGAVRDAFKTAVNAIGRVWNRLKDVAKTPVNFVIKIYNDGIVRLVNGLAGLVGIKTRLQKLPTFSRGGVLPGHAPGRDTLIAGVSPGESIFRPEFTRAVGKRFVYTANRIARTGGVQAVRRWLTGPDAIGGEGLAFARGGVVPRFAGTFALGGIVRRFVAGVRDFTIGRAGPAAKKLLDRIIGVVPGSGLFRDVIAAVPEWLKDKILGWITNKVDSGVGGARVQRALAWARTQHGKPYVWGGVGPGGYDCSGFMSAITNVLQGRNPYSRRFTTFSFTGASTGPAGFVRNLRSGFMVGITNRGVGHMAGTLGGVPVESSGSAGVRVGAGARGHSHPMFDMVYGLKVHGLKFDRGGWLPPGWNVVYNGLRHPEPVLPSIDALGDLAADRGPLVGEVHVHHVPGYSTPDDVVRGLRRAELRARYHRRR